MWKLMNMDGTVFRDGYENQWDALVSAHKQNGDRYKKAEALQVPSGTVVYKQHYISRHCEYSSISDDGKLYDSYSRKYSVPTMRKFILQQY